MMLSMAQEMVKEYPGIELWNTNIDAQMMWLTKNPETYGVLVSGNMFGDIVSDGFAGLVGGLGFACSANVGEKVAIFEPTHGSAPKYAGYATPIVNPIAMILSACMMLDHIGESEKATAIRNAISRVVEEGKVKAYDMMKIAGSPDVINQGAATTREMTDTIISTL
jgi:3-isopropylmalate dehydrogenase